MPQGLDILHEWLVFPKFQCHYWGEIIRSLWPYNDSEKLTASVLKEVNWYNGREVPLLYIIRNVMHS